MPRCWASPDGDTRVIVSAPRDLRYDPEFARLLAGSFRRFVGRDMVEGVARVDPAWLQNEAPFAVLAHDAAREPRFIYANAVGLRLFGYAWEELVELPSRLSAEPDKQAARRRLLAAAARDGFYEGYSGIRVAKSGRRFRIEGVTLWNLVDADGRMHGQASIIRAWRDAE